MAGRKIEKPLNLIGGHFEIPRQGDMNIPPPWSLVEIGTIIEMLSVKTTIRGSERAVKKTNRRERAEAPYGRSKKLSLGFLSTYI